MSLIGICYVLNPLFDHMDSRVGNGLIVGAKCYLCTKKHYQYEAKGKER